MITRVLVGGLGLLLYFLGRGVRVTTARESTADYVVSLVSQLLGTALLVLVFTVWRHSRLRGPKARSQATSLSVLGWLHLAMAGLLFWAVVSLIVLAVQLEAPAREIFTDLIATPDFMFRLLTGLLAVGAGATALAKARGSAALLRAVAIPLATIWPHGFILAAWSAWSSIPPSESVSSMVPGSDPKSAAG